MTGLNARSVLHRNMVRRLYNAPAGIVSFMMHVAAAFSHAPGASQKPIVAMKVTLRQRVE
jgi:hypothetical protein